jgi:hypothetical protein
MAKWKDKTKGYDNPEVVESEIKLGIFRLSIHHYINCGDQRFASCGRLFDRHKLDGQDLASLKIQALARFEHILIDAQNDIPHSSL